MLFRNLTLFRFPESALPADLSALEAMLSEAALRPVGAMELASHGFVSPYGRGEPVHALVQPDAILVAYGAETKLMPAAIINAELAKRLDHILAEEGRRPGGRERKRLKDEVLTDLLPRAFVRPGRTQAYLDRKRHWCVVDSSSRKVGENLVSGLREAMGSFPAVPVNAECSPRALLTGWIAGEPLPQGFVLGDECELRDPVESGAIVKCRRHELESDEIREHLKTGKQAFQVALVFNDRLSFVLGEDLVIRKLRFLETAMESLENTERDSQHAEVDAAFALMSGEIGALLDALQPVLQLSDVQ
jgi:recombination associated protein RdgC